MRLRGKYHDSQQVSSDDYHLPRVRQIAGQDGQISKHDFVKHLKYSKYFLKSFDKNDDGIITEVGTIIIRTCLSVLPYC